MNIALRNVPDSVYRVIKREAKSKGRSPNAHIIQILAVEAAHVERLQKLTNARQQFDRFAASLPPPDDIASLIREDRER